MSRNKQNMKTADLKQAAIWLTVLLLLTVSVLSVLSGSIAEKSRTPDTGTEGEETEAPAGPDTTPAAETASDTELGEYTGVIDTPVVRPVPEAERKKGGEEDILESELAVLETDTIETDGVDEEPPENHEEDDDPIDEDGEEIGEDPEYGILFDPDFMRIGEEDKPFRIYDVPLSAEKQYYVVKIAQKFGIPPELIFATMYRETRYDETLNSKNGKYIGIMQVALSNMPMFRARMAGFDPVGTQTDTEILSNFYRNVKAGAYILSRFYTKYDGDIFKVMMCYHRGTGNAKTLWERGKTSDSYSREVKEEMHRIAMAEIFWQVEEEPVPEAEAEPHQVPCVPDDLPIEYTEK